jgi:hypothetical protein
LAGSTKQPPAARKRGRTTLRIKLQRRWTRYFLYASTGIAVVIVAGLGSAYFSFARMIDERLHGERERTLPRVLRPAHGVPPWADAVAAGCDRSASMIWATPTGRP